MKESLAKITAWIKAHPIPAAIIGLVIVVVGYFVVKSSGGNSGGESIDGGSLGAEESSPLVGLGGGDMSTGSSTTSTGTTPESIPASTGATTPAYNDISTPSAAASIGTFAAPSDFVNESAIFSGATAAADVISPKTTLADSGFTRSVNAGVDTGNKSDGARLKSTNTGQPARPLTRLGIGSALSRLTSPLKAPSLASIQRVTTTPSPAAKLNAALSSALVKTPPAKPGYKWDTQLRKYVRLTSTVKKAKAR